MTNRRRFLRASGVLLSLPCLETFAAPATTSSPRRRTVAINIGLGLHGPNLFPQKPGKDYELTPYLRELQDFRNDFTILSGTSHPGVDGGHSAEKSFLTAAPHPGSASFKNTISIDQLLAEKVGAQSRFGYLALSLSGRSLSWSRSGVELPSETRPSKLFEKLFLDGKPDEKQKQLQRLRDGQSIMDTVSENARRMSRRVSRRDQQKLEQYYSVVRDTEQRLQSAEQWEHEPKPDVDRPIPKDISDKTEIIGKAELMYDLMHLAIATDSTRAITFFSNGINAVPKIAGVTQDYHNLSHHGKDPEKIEELTVIETQQMRAFAGFVRKLRDTDEDGVSLLDRTQILFGSNLGNASSHNNQNLPILLVGGGYRHGQHLAFDPENNHPLPQLFVTMLQRMGVETDAFAGITGTLPGLELV
ncbi:DUF1552 domain-containing protein [Neorhodopirellula pilleata]|uniref:DUF1552 domain-containing protein n=1 Tax=Neorhodopirellula pilleata TaxID=2714738 RepID=A0A5C6AQ84_9BACT|nr:DUF1552 domain-containing protein [Neorhodopirellula pilleata]TWU01389.1 hypothetical protein Pla100_11160 [Neorhodopirellula pilleata]